MAFPVTSPKQRTVRYGVIDAHHPTPHSGDDFGRYVGGVQYPLDCFAIAGGTIQSGSNAQAGKFINIIKGKERFLYGHLAEILQKSGDVAEGKKIAIMGETGNADGVHLHFGYYVDGVQTDPQKAYNKYGVKKMLTDSQLTVLIRHYRGTRPTEEQQKKYVGKVTWNEMMDIIIKSDKTTALVAQSKAGKLKAELFLPTRYREVYKPPTQGFVEVSETLYRKVV